MQNSTARYNTGGKPKANSPVHSVRFGSVKAAVWDNETEHGIMHNVTVTRPYRDYQGSWQENGSFGAHETFQRNGESLGKPDILTVVRKKRSGPIFVQYSLVEVVEWLAPVKL